MLTLFMKDFSLANVLQSRRDDMFIRYIGLFSPYQINTMNAFMAFSGTEEHPNQ